MNVVERLWSGETCVILGGGPSLTIDQVEVCRGRAKVIAIKDAIDLAPWADVLYCAGADPARWWQHHGDRLAGFAGPRYTLDPKASTWATVLQQTGMTGLETDPSGLRTGKNSGYQAINLAVHLGARRILLLGYDMQQTCGRDHWFDRKPYAPLPFADFRAAFETIVAPLRACGVEVLNATPGSALHSFPHVDLADALACEVAA